jgi:hypothetical protein
MTFPRSANTTQLQTIVQKLEQRVKALEAVIKISGSTVEVKSPGEIKLTAGTKIGAKASTTLNLEAGAGAEVKASAILNLKGATINLN